MLRTINLVGAALVLVLSASSSLSAANNSSQFTTKPKREHLGCHGAAQCAGLIEFLGPKCKDFRCNNDSGQPSCWCEL